MIKVQYLNEEIVLTPEDMDENQKLMNCIKTISGVYYKQGVWYVPPSEVDALNESLAPLSGQFLICQTFTSFIQNRKQKLIIKCGVIESRIIGKDIPHKEIEDATKYFWKPAVRQEKFKSGKWDGYIKLYKRWEHSFPTGLLYLVKEVLDKQGIPYTIQYLYEQRPRRQFDWYVNDGLTPDPDQYEAIEAGYDGLRGVLKAPTGFGKTAILAKRLTAKFGVPTLFVANKKSLLDDAASEFLNGVDGLDEVAQIKEGVFGFTKVRANTTIDDVTDITAPVVVATIQSLSARLQDPRTANQLRHWLNNVCQFIMIDECQAMGTTTWDTVLNECKAPLRIALSATPNRTDGAKLKINAQSGPVLFFTTAEEQIEKGRLCELDIRYRVYDQKLYNQYDTDVQYQDAYRAWIVENMERNEIVVNEAMNMIDEGRLVLVLIQFIDHGMLLRDMFIGKGINPNDVRFIYGNTTDEARTSAIREFRKGAFKVLIGSTIFDAGVNIPSISGVVLAGSGNSEITLIQRIGRGARNADYEELLGYLPEFMRNSHGKKVTKVVDIMDDNVKFFTSQGWNRYKIAREEFGVSRVYIDGQMTKKVKKTQVKTDKQINSLDAQLEMLSQFRTDDELGRVKRNDTTKSQLDLFDAFKGL